MSSKEDNAKTTTKGKAMSEPLKRIQAGTYETLDGRYRMIKIHNDGSFGGAFTWQLAERTSCGWEGFDSASTKSGLYQWLKTARKNEKGRTVKLATITVHLSGIGFTKRVSLDRTDGPSEADKVERALREGEHPYHLDVDPA